MAKYDTFLLQLSHQASYAKGDSVAVVPQDFLLIFDADPSELPSTVKLRLLHLVSPGVVLEEGRTGRIAIWSRSGRGVLSRRMTGQMKLVASMTGSVLYREMQRNLEPLGSGSDVLLTPREIFNGTLEVEIDAVVEKRRSSLRMNALRLQLEVVKPLLGRFLRVDLSASDLSVPISELPAGDLAKQLIHREGVRTLKLQPVGFRINESDRDPTGVSWEDQSKEAERLWKSEILTFERRSLHFENREDLKKSEEVTKILDSWEDVYDCRVVEVFFTGGEIPGGGGVTRDAGTGLDNVVISDKEAKKNARLLAHELGHVLSATHPRQDAPDGYWTAEDGTVMEPSNEMGNPNPDSNSERNRYKATNFAIDGAGCPRAPV